MEQLHTRVPKELYDAVRTIARDQGVPIRQVVEKGLAAGMAALEGGDESVGLGVGSPDSLPGAPAIQAILHPSCIFGSSSIEMEFDQRRSACKVTLKVSGSKESKKPEVEETYVFDGDRMRKVPDEPQETIPESVPDDVVEQMLV